MIDWRREAERSLPMGLEALTPEWLTTALRAWDETNPVIGAVKVERIGAGYGLTGAVGRAYLQWEGNDARLPTSVIVKLPMAQSGEASLYRQREEQGSPASSPYFQRSAREVCFYQALAPSGFAPAPGCYFAATSEEQGAIVLVLEDVANARQGDVLEGASIEEVAAVLEAIAPFHARWWKPVAKRDDIPSWLQRWGGDPARRHERYRSQIGPFLDRWEDTLIPEVIELIQLMESRYGDVLTAIDQIPRSAIHADLHLDNLLFSSVPAGPDVFVLDWQSVCVGPIAVDLCTLITGSLAPDDFRLGLDDLTRLYSAALTTYGDIDYPAENVKNDVRLALLWRLGGTVGWLSHAVVEQMTGRERELVIAAFGDGRLTSALLEMDVHSLLLQF